MAQILVADDDRAIRTVLSQALTRAGHSVRSTGTSAQLWQWVEDGAIWLVLQNDCPLCPCGPPEGTGSFDGQTVLMACNPGVPPP